MGFHEFIWSIWLRLQALPHLSLQDHRWHGEPRDNSWQPSVTSPPIVRQSTIFGSCKHTVDHNVYIYIYHIYNMQVFASFSRHIKKSAASSPAYTILPLRKKSTSAYVRSLCPPPTLHCKTHMINLRNISCSSLWSKIHHLKKNDADTKWYK